MNKKTLLLIITISPILVYGQSIDNSWIEKQLKPNYIQAQFAGNVGFISVGIGKKYLNNRLSSTLMYGYVPYFVGKSTIGHITQKISYNLPSPSKSRFKNLTPYVGMAISIETGRNSFISLPDKYPEKYYPPNAFSFPIFSGLTYHKKNKKESKLEGIEYYIEVGSLASYAYYNIITEEYFNPDILSLAFGIRLIRK